jgi:hypothetical protein
MKKPFRGLPSFISPKNSAGEIEEILSRKIKQQSVKEFLGTTQNSVGEEKFTKIRLKMKVNLIEEYKAHLEAVDKLSNFPSMKMYMDHNFFKIYMPEEIISN